MNDIGEMLKGRRIFISVITGRGGTGKSTVAELMATTLHIPPTMVFTTDTTNATARKIGLTTNSDVQLLGERPETAMLDMMSPLMEQPEGVVIVDHGAREEPQLNGKWGAIIQKAAEYNIELLVVRPIPNDPTSRSTCTACAQKVINSGGRVFGVRIDQPKWTPSALTQWNNDATRQSLIAKGYVEVAIGVIPEISREASRRLGIALKDIAYMRFDRLEGSERLEAEKTFRWAAVTDLQMYLSETVDILQAGLSEVLRNSRK